MHSKILTDRGKIKNALLFFMPFSKINKIQLGLAQYLAAAVYRIYPSAISLRIGVFPYGCFYDFGIAKFSEELTSSIEKILHTMVEKESAVRREMIAKNAVHLFRAENKNHLAKEAATLGNKLIYVFQLHSFFYLSEQDFSLDFSRLYFTVKEFRIRGSLSNKGTPIVRVITYTAFSKEEHRNLLRRRREISARSHETIGQKLGIFRFECDQDLEKIVWMERGTFLFFRLQQFWKRFLRIYDGGLIQPYPVRKERKDYLDQLEELPTTFSHNYLEYNEKYPSKYLSPFPNLYTLPFEMKDCSYEFCSTRSWEKRFRIKQNLIEACYHALGIPYFKKKIKDGYQYFYDSILGQSLSLGYVSITPLNKNLATIEYSLLHSIERILGILLEHFGQNLPFWLHPIQINIFYDPSQLSVIKKIVLNKNVTYHLQKIKKKNEIPIQEDQGFYTFFFLKNGEIRIKGQKKAEQKISSFELDKLLQELEKKNCPEKLIIG